MTKKIVVRTGEVAGFFDRAKNAAQRADRGGEFSGTVTLSFEDPQKMFTVLSDARRRLMREIMREPKTINELAGTLHRDRSAPIDEVDASAIKVGQTVRITLDAIKGKSFSGKVRRIAPYVLEI